MEVDDIIQAYRDLVTAEIRELRNVPREALVIVRSWRLGL